MNTKRAVKVKTKCWALQCFVAFVDWILAIWLFFIWLQYLIFIFVIIIFLFAVHQSVACMLAFRIESVDDYLFGAFNLSSTEWTSLKTIITRSCLKPAIRFDSKSNSLVLLNQLAMPWDKGCIANVHMAQFWCLYHSPHIFYTIGKCFLLMTNHKNSH